MQNTCTQCSTTFEITDSDLAFYDAISPIFNGKKELVPPPTQCPNCRKRRRLAWRNERTLYHRKCDLTGKQVISVFSPDKPFKVYRQQDWWTDKWDAMSYGRDFDFSRPFFDQYAELLMEVPCMNVIGEANENCDYCNLIANCKDCYLVFESSNNEDCLYGYWLQKCDDCCDVSFSHESRFCYEVDNCYNCHQLSWSQNCTNCHSSAFLYDCIGCSNCLFSTNLRQKEYCILNEQYSKEDYEKKYAEFYTGSHAAVQEMKKIFREFLLKQPHRAAQMINAENCTGDYVQSSKNCRECYHAHEAEDCTFGEHVWRGSRSNMDVSTVGRDAEMIYEAINTGIGSKNNLFTIQCWSGTNDLLYCYDCFSSHHCFGCSGMKQKSYCIFNKQYTKEEYEELVPKIIEHMRKTNEYGEFFSADKSLFAYNETVAHESFPLTKEEVMKRGWQWREDDVAENQYLGPISDIPDDIRTVDDAICKQILLCEVTNKPYKIIPQELKFYREMKLPIPRLCPDERHKERMIQRNPQKLWERKCANCSKDIQTTYAPDRTEIVYCEDCYLSTVY